MSDAQPDKRGTMQMNRQLGRDRGFEGSKSPEDRVSIDSGFDELVDFLMPNGFMLRLSCDRLVLNGLVFSSLISLFIFFIPKHITEASYIPPQIMPTSIVTSELVYIHHNLNSL